MFRYKKEKGLKYKRVSQEATTISAWINRRQKNRETSSNCQENHDTDNKGENKVQGINEQC